MPASVRMLGSPLVKTDGAEHEPGPGKTSGLLLYLAWADGWVVRDDLLYLLWPDTDEAKARNSLRQVLHALKDVPYAQELERERSRVRWKIDTDLTRFRRAVEQGDAPRATESYSAPFLDGFRIAGAPEFATWVEMERDELHRAWRDISLAYVESLTRDGRFDDAVRVLERVLGHDPLDEAALRAHLEALAAAGRRSAAIAAYEQFRAHLADDLGVAPDPATVAIVERLRRPASGPARSRSSPVRSTGLRRTSATPFVGRTRELAALEDLVDRPATRLVTLVAPGGMGKTRLAESLVQNVVTRGADGLRSEGPRPQANRRWEDVAVARFDAIERAGDMEPLLAESLGIVLAGSRSPRAQILSELSERTMLLVLDNLEHLTDDLTLVQDLLAYCPGVVLVATSRVRLGLQVEHAFDVGALSVPDLAGDDPLASEAVQLFLAAAERVGGDAREAVDPVDAARIARLVHGMPLALELAAAWLRVLGPEEIVTELDGGLDLLESESPDVPERHRSVRGVFASTWTRLGERERTAWAKLSLFEGGFTRGAAEEAADVRLPVLLALVNKAIVARSTDGRFDLHPLLRRFGRERAVELGLADEMRACHAEHYLGWMAERGAEIVTAKHVDAIHAIEAELPNLRTAWRSAVDCGRFGHVADAVQSFCGYFGYADQIHGEWADLCTFAVAELEAGAGPDGEDADPERLRALAWTLPFAMHHATPYRDRVHRALALAKRVGDERAEALALSEIAQASPLDEARTWLARAIEAWEALGNDHEAARLRVADGTFHRILTGQYREGIALLERAAATFRRLGDQRHEARALDSIAVGHLLAGDLDAAERFVARTQAILDHLSLSEAGRELLATRRWIAAVKGEFEAAERYLEAYLDVRRRGGSDVEHLEAFLRAGQDYARGTYEDPAYYESARIHARTVLDDLNARGRRGVDRMLVELALGRMELRDGDAATAANHVRVAVDIALDANAPRFLMDAAAAVSELLVARGDPACAGALAAAVLEDPSSEIDTRREIERLREGGLTLRPGACRSSEAPPPDAPVEATRAWIRTVVMHAIGGDPEGGG